MLVVDDEPDNLDLLYRTFRRDFNVLRAESGVMALEVLASEGEVAVIISDQRMPEMKGTEFLSKTVPQFPDTMRIILTGFTDVEDLVEAINSGQVYKYITKPWDPNELKQVVQRAAETYELLKQRTEELHQAQTQITLFSTIAQAAQQASSFETGISAIASAFKQSLTATDCQLWSDWASSPDELVQAAGRQTETQVAHGDGIEASSAIATPVTFQGNLLAVLSLQGTQPLRPEEMALIELAAQQSGVALASLR
jgi:response regulator RpfG family c-di-GMP phosphodiesterase